MCKKLSSIFLLAIAFQCLLHSQALTREDAIRLARERSVSALEAKSSFVSSYWAWRSYKASRLPSLYLYGEVGSFDRSLRLLQNYETGEMVYVENYNMQNSIGLKARQNITLTGGTLSLYSDLTRIDQFGTSGKTWYAQPFTLSYSQPIFGYNQFRWDKLISPKEYEKAKKVYIESMEQVTINAVDRYFALMLAQMNYDSARSNYSNTSRMLSIASQRLSIGSVTREEYLQLELSAINDSISINEKYVALREAQMQLCSLLGYDEKSSPQPIMDDALPDIVIDYDFVREKAGRNSSFDLDNEINILNAESAVAKAKADRGITMQLNARFGLSNSAEDFKHTYQGLLDQEVVGLSFSIPIFDWGEGKGKVKKAEAAADVVRAQVRQAENDYEISLFTAVGQFNNQRQQCGASSRARAIAQERYSLVMDKFSRGNASVTDLNTARSENDAALQKYVNDISNYWKYYYTLRQLTLYDFISGRDLDVSYDELLE